MDTDMLHMCICFGPSEASPVQRSRAGSSGDFGRPSRAERARARMSSAVSGPAEPSGLERRFRAPQQGRAGSSAKLISCATPQTCERLYWPSTELCVLMFSIEFEDLCLFPCKHPRHWLYLYIVYKGVQGSKGPGGPRTCCMLPIHQKTYHDHKTPKPFRERKNSKKKPRRYLTRDRSLSNETCVMFNVFWIATTLGAVMRISGIIAWIILF
jgi:hypothetical protein